MRAEKNGKVITVIFESVSEYADFAGKIPKRDAAEHHGMDGGADPWVGAANMASGIVPAKLHDEAMALFNKIDVSFRDRTVQQWECSMAGAYPIVPEYLMGMPENMRDRIAVEHQAAPLEMYIEAAIASGVTGRELAARGAAVAAFIMRVAEERPVSLTFLSHNYLGTASGHSVYMKVPIDTNPVSLTQVLSVFAVAQSVRSVRFAAMQECLKLFGQRFNPVSETVTPAWKNVVCDPPKRALFIREHWGINEKAIVVQRGNYEDSSLMLSDPVEWVHKQLDKQRAVE